MRGTEEVGGGRGDVLLQGQLGYSEERQHEMCSYDSTVEDDKIDFSLLFVAG